MIGSPSRLRLTRKAAALARVLPTFARSCEENAAIVALEIELERVVQQRLHAMRAAHARKVVSIRQLVSAYVSIRQRTSASAYVHRQQAIPSAYVHRQQAIPLPYSTSE